MFSWLSRHFFAQVMFITAFAGAAGAWRWGSSLIECKSVDYEPVDRLMEQLGPVFFCGLGGLDFQEMARTRFQDFPTIQ